MPEVLLEFLGDAPSWLLLLLIPLYFWGKLNHDALHNRATHPESFERTIGWLRENNLGLLYLKTLGWLMDKISDIIGDRQQFNQIYVAAAHPKGFIHKIFGLNPFTPKSYDKCLSLAFLYPVFSFVITWALGSSGQIGNVDWLSQQQERVLILQEWQRWLLLGTLLLLMMGGLWFAGLWGGWQQLLALNMPFLLVNVVIALFVANQQTTSSILSGWLIGWLAFLFLFIPMYLAGWVMGLLIYRSAKEAHETIHDTTLTVAAAFAIAVAVVNVAGAASGSATSIITFAGAVAVAIAFAVAVAFTGGGVGGGSVAFAGAGAVIVAASSSGVVAFAFGAVGELVDVVAVDSVYPAAYAGITIIILRALQKWSVQHNSLAWFWLVYSVLFFMLGYVVLDFLENSQALIFLMFWLLLPLVNAPMDWLSLGVTRGLLQSMRAGQHSGLIVLVWTVADLLFALVFLFLITAALVGMTALGNATTSKILVDISHILKQVRNDPANINQWWIYFMLLSTLVPTLVHFALAGGVATLWLPRKARLWLANGLERDLHKTFAAWAYLTFMPMIGFILMPCALLYFLWWLLNVHGGWLGMRLLDWAEMLAHFANPAMQ